MLLKVILPKSKFPFNSNQHLHGQIPKIKLKCHYYHLSYLKLHNFKSKIYNSKKHILTFINLIETMDEKDYTNVEFWNSKTKCKEYYKMDISSVTEDKERAFNQACATFRFFELKLHDNTKRKVIIKNTLPILEKFKNQEHFERTGRSYLNEAIFYTKKSLITEIKLAYPLYISIKDTNYNSKEIILILEDLTENGSKQYPMLSFEQAKLALKWLAQFHSHFWNNNDDDKLWEHGSYWSLDKRKSDLDQLEMEWEKTCSNFESSYPTVFQKEDIKNLAKKIKEIAYILDKDLNNYKEYETLIHGDFKAANIFIKENEISLCDYQWTGPGLGIKDVIYLLWSSVDPAVMSYRENELLKHYYDILQNKLKIKYDWKLYREHSEKAYLDYIRFLIGSMWGKVTPESHKNLNRSNNHGLHKRNPDHLVFMVKKANNVLNTLCQKLKEDSHSHSNILSGSDLIIDIIIKSINISEQAGIKIREILGESGGKLVSRDKSGDGPQTQADIESEKMIVGSLLSAFPGILIIGEEGTVESDIIINNITFNNYQKEDNKEIIQNLKQNEKTKEYEKIKLKDLTIWVDPLDGTQELLDGNIEGVAVLIGVAYEGRPIAGIMHQPFVKSKEGRFGITWYGGPGFGVFKENKEYDPFKMNLIQYDKCIVATTRSFPSQIVTDFANKLKPDKIVNVGGVGSKSFMLLKGQITHYVFRAKGTKRWDSCAPEALLRALGGHVTDANGAVYDYSPDCYPRNDNGIVAVLSNEAWIRCINCFNWDV